jgi:hypothetical protein
MHSRVNLIDAQSLLGALARATINGKVTPTNKHAHQDKEIL